MIAGRGVFSSGSRRERSSEMRHGEKVFFFCVGIRALMLWLLKILLCVCRVVVAVEWCWADVWVL